MSRLIIRTALYRIARCFVGPVHAYRVVFTGRSA